MFLLDNVRPCLVTLLLLQVKAFDEGIFNRGGCCFWVFRSSSLIYGGERGEVEILLAKVITLLEVFSKLFCCCSNEC